MVINKPLFAKGSFLGLRFFIFLILSLVLIIADHRFHYFKKIKPELSVVALPIQEIVNLPIKFVGWIEDHIRTQHQLLAENQELKVNQLLLEAKLQKLLAIQQENDQLRALLSSTQHIDDRVLVAQLLAVNTNPFDGQIILDKGRKHGIYAGQPVLDAGGVMGQVISVGPFTCKVLLITSTRSAVPVQDSRNGLRAIAVGTGYSGILQLVHVPDTVDIKVGDLLVTSGLGLRFPIGYPVGTVASVNHIPGEKFAQIDITPAAEVDRSRQVLLVWPDQIKLAKTVNELLASS